MKERGHFNVIFVSTVVLARITSKHTLTQFMKERSHFNVISVITVVIKRVA